MSLSFTIVKYISEEPLGRPVLLVGQLVLARPDRWRPRAAREAYPAFPGWPTARAFELQG